MVMFASASNIAIKYIGFEGGESGGRIFGRRTHKGPYQNLRGRIISRFAVKMGLTYLKSS
jgi:hypothetical protein